jgi:protein ImuA
MEPARSGRAEGFCASASGRESDTALLMAALRRHIARIEQATARFETAHHPRGQQSWLTGVAAVDGHLPAQGLARSGLHDVSPASHGDVPAAMGFTLALALCRLAEAGERRPLLWCRLAAMEREHGRLYGHGLEGLGLARRRFITVTLKKPAALLWTMEEALKSGALALVIGEAGAEAAGLSITRRLLLAAQAGKSAGLLVFARPAATATASHTRWQVAAAASPSLAHDPAAPGAPAWAVELIRARGGRPGSWHLQWHRRDFRNAAHGFSLVPGLRRGTLHPWADQAGTDTAPEEPALRAG